MSPINPAQQGIIAEQEFQRLLILASTGDLEVSKTPDDDERCDLETRVRGERVIFQIW